MLPPDEPSLLATNVNSILTNNSRRDQRRLLENIKLYIATHRARLNQLADMEASLVQALSEYRYSDIGQHHSRVPVEILREIFLRCVPVHGRCSPSRRQAPMVLMQVCQHWRQVATSLQSLWSSLSIDMQSLHRWRELVIAWFERSGLQSLSLTIKPPPGAREAGCIEYLSGWPLLSDPKPFSLEYLNRFWPKIKRLEVDVDTVGTSLTLLGRYGFHFGQPNPNLRHLAVYAVESMESTLTLAPNLQTLQITKIRRGYGDLHLNLRSATLQKLCISDGGMPICLDAIHEILDGCPSLVHLELVSSHWQVDESRNSVYPPQEYPKLEHLGLRLREGICPLLQTIRLPGLTSLACGKQDWTSDDVDIFKNFLEESACELTSFRGYIPWFGIEFQLNSWTLLLDTLGSVQMLELEIEELQQPSGLSPPLKLVTALLPRLPRLEEVRIKATSQVEPHTLSSQWPVHDRHAERLDYFHLHSVLASMRLRAFKLAIQTLDTRALFNMEQHYSDLSSWCPTAAEEFLLHDLIARGTDFVLRVDADPSRGLNHSVVHFPPDKRIGKCNMYVGTRTHLDLSADYYEEELLRIGSCSRWPN